MKMWRRQCGKTNVLFSSFPQIPILGLMVRSHEKQEKAMKKLKFACPQAVINYTKQVGGVDVSDQRREYYGVGRSSKKWWKFILHYVLNVCLVNCFILHDLTNHPPSTAHGNRQLTFRRNVVRQLIGTVTSRKCTGRREVRLSELHSLIFSILYKSTRPCKSVRFVYREKEKSSIRKG